MSKIAASLTLMVKITPSSLIRYNGVKKMDNKSGGEIIKKLTTNKKTGKLFKSKILNKIKKTDKTKNYKGLSFLTFKTRLAFTQ